MRPKTVSRYICELRDHLDDLTAELEANGLSHQMAEARALARLGSIEALVFPMTSDRRFHSLAANMPCAVFLLAPIIGYGLAVAVLAFTLASATSFGTAPDWLGIEGWATKQFAAFVVPLILAWTVAFMALRQRSRAIWPLLGMALTIVAAAATDFRLSVSDTQQGGEIAVGLTAPSATQLIALLLAAAAPLLLMRKHRHTHSQD